MSDTPTEAPAEEKPAEKATPEADPDVFPRDYVESLRREGQEKGTKIRELQEQLAEYAVFDGLDKDARTIFTEGAKAYATAAETKAAEDWDNAAAWFMEQGQGLSGEDSTPTPSPQPPAPIPEEIPMADEPTPDMLAAGAAQGLTKEDLRAALAEMREDERQQQIVREVTSSLKELGYDDPGDPFALAISKRASEIARETGRTDTRALFSEAAEQVKADAVKRFSLIDNQTDAAAAPAEAEQTHVTPPGGVAPGKTGGGDEPAPRSMRGQAGKDRRAKAADLVRSIQSSGSADPV